MTLHVVYRSSAAENHKNRPDYYSKAIALASVIDAAQHCQGDSVELIFLNDGPIPADRAPLMRSAGEIVQIRRGSNRGSYLFAIKMASGRRWPADDLVLLAEDDYLYRADALEQLARCARVHTGVDYFYPYAKVAEPRSWTPSQPQEWVPFPTTTSTFALRAAALAQDKHILLAAPFTGGNWDHASLLAIQGTQPFALRAVMRHPLRQRHHSALNSVARSAFLTVSKSAVNALAWSHGLRVTRRALAASPPLATHLETGHIAWGTDWAERANQLRA